MPHVYADLNTWSSILVLSYLYTLIVVVHRSVYCACTSLRKLEMQCTSKHEAGWCDPNSSHFMCISNISTGQLFSGQLFYTTGEFIKQQTFLPYSEPVNQHKKHWFPVSTELLGLNKIMHLEGFRSFNISIKLKYGSRLAVYIVTHFLH